MFSLICVWINGWVNNRETGDLRRYRVHYDVIVMICGPQSACWYFSFWQCWVIGRHTKDLRGIFSLLKFLSFWRFQICCYTTRRYRSNCRRVYLAKLKLYHLKGWGEHLPNKSEIFSEIYLVWNESIIGVTIFGTILRNFIISPESYTVSSLPRYNLALQMWDLPKAITVPADALAPGGARPSADKIMID